jgi:hypothetical protein
MLACAGTSLKAQIKTIDWLTPVSDFQGRVLEWDTDRSRIAIEQPLALRFHSDSQGLSVTLVHSGYTQEDPDGKFAILSVSSESFNNPLVQSEKTALAQQGFVFQTGISLDSANHLSVDVELPDNAIEESRIRGAVGLPVPVSAGATFPLQVRWTGVDGATLYNWLTDPQKGLSIVLRASTSARTDQRRKLTLVAAKLAQWWGSFGDGNTQIRWIGDAGPALRSIVDFGCVEEASHSGIALSAADIVRDWPAMLAALNGALTQSGGYSVLSRERLLNSTWTFDSSFQLVVPAQVKLTLSPGQILLNHPELVSDLSGSGQGLGALKTPPPPKPLSKGR